MNSNMPLALSQLSINLRLRRGQGREGRGEGGEEEGGRRDGGLEERGKKGK